jgi:hypothetical protein
MTLTILLLVIPVVGSVLGLIGKTWDETKTSKIKLTSRGWTSLSIILIGLFFTGYSTVHLHRQKEQLEQSRAKVQALVYHKIYDDCIAALQPLITIYYENRGENRTIPNEEYYYSELASEKAKDIFTSVNLLDRVKQGTAFEEWDNSYANYIHGYYNGERPYNLRNTMARWADYIDLEDLILIDSINNDYYWITLQNACDPNTRHRDLREFNFYDNDDDIFPEHQKCILQICTLLNKARNISYSRLHPKNY